MDGSNIESGLQLFSRLKQRPNLEKLHPILFGESGPFPNELVEIVGSPETGTDKTLLLTDLLARCLLPQQYKGVDLPGKNCGAIIIDIDHHFDILKLIEVMEFIIKRCFDKIVKLSAASIEKVIETCLSNLIVLNCYNSQQFQITLLNLEKIISENINIGLVVVDSISAYYWEYRNSNSIISLQAYHRKVLESLQESVKSSNVVLIFTRADVNISLDVCYKINLSEYKDKFQCAVVYCSTNIHKTVPYRIETTIKFENN